MKKQLDIKKPLLLNLPYILMGDVYKRQLICRIYMRAYQTFVKRPRSVREMRSFIMCYSLGERSAAV